MAQTSSKVWLEETCFAWREAMPAFKLYGIGFRRSPQLLSKERLRRARNLTWLIVEL